MNENNNDELEAIKKQLINDAKQQSRKDAQVAAIREQLEAIAVDSSAKYHREVGATRPDAETIIDKVIQPWFTNIIASGVYAELLRRCKYHQDDIRLSAPIIYYWPSKAIRSISNVVSFASTAQFVAENYKKTYWQQGIQIHADKDEAWYTGFDLYSYAWNKTEGLKIWRQPARGMGFGYAMVARDYDISVEAQNVVASLDKISPEVWIKFGQQVQSGQVLETIKQSLQPRRNKVQSLLVAQQSRQIDARVAEEYLRTRKWY